MRLTDSALNIVALNAPVRATAGDRRQIDAVFARQLPRGRGGQHFAGRRLRKSRRQRNGFGRNRLHSHSGLWRRLVRNALAWLTDVGDHPKTNQLFYVLGMDRAVMYRVATAKKGFEWTGVNKVSAKTQWPDWRPPVEMLQRRPELPSFMAGGPKNPLGARAIYLGSTIYRIHGTNEPKSIGKAASSGCIRMLNEDVSELYNFVKQGAEVTVM